MEINYRLYAGLISALCRELNAQIRRGIKPTLNKENFFCITENSTRLCELIVLNSFEL